MEGKEEYFKFLDELREKGATNMFGAGPWLRRAFPSLTMQESQNILGEWMRTFGERHPTTP